MVVFKMKPKQLYKKKGSIFDYALFITKKSKLYEKGPANLQKLTNYFPMVRIPYNQCVITKAHVLSHY